jgi:peptidyl-prolyl cis-trans isomerase D
VSDADIQKYFDAHKDDFGDRPGRAVLSVTMIPRIPTAADTAAARAKAVAVRNEIVGGAKFEDVAKRESADSASAAQGGSLGKTTKGQFVKAFEDAAYALKPGEISQPVLTPFGFHIIRVDEHKGDTISARHVLIPIQQSDSSASASDRLADALAKAAGSEKPAIFDSVTKALGLKVGHVVAIENEPLVWNGNYVPSLSAWAFGGARPGETSDLVDDDRGYYLGRLDSLQAGWSKTSGSQSDKAKLAAFRDDIRRELVREKKLDLLIPKAKQITSAVNAGQTLAQAAQSVGATVQQSPMFTRTTPVAGLGQASEAIGAAFGLPVGAVSAPIKTRTNVVVEKVDRRVPADRAAWEKQKDAQRQQYVQRLRQQRVQDFMASLRETAKIEDHRKEIQAESRQASS